MTEILILLSLILFLYYLYFLTRIYSGLFKLKKDNAAVPDEFVSVIIPFRNEEENILSSLFSIQNQDYPPDKFEVIYVNDFSEDNSVSILAGNIRAKNVRVINANHHGHSASHKKAAIQAGIENSVGDIIVTTDADCIHNRSWLSILLRSFSQGTAMVSGGVRFHPLNNFFDKIQALEFASLIISGAGLIGSGSPVICNGANLAYRKKVFYALNGFRDNHHIASGDDEFLMQKINRETGCHISFCGERDAVVSTKPNSSFRAFLNQRKRWGSKGLFYNPKVMLQLILIFLFYLSLPLQLVLSFWYPAMLLNFAVIFIIKISVEFIILRKGTELLFDTSLLKYFLITELLHIPYIIIMPIAGTFGGFTWKNREIKR